MSNQYGVIALLKQCAFETQVTVGNALAGLVYQLKIKASSKASHWTHRLRRLLSRGAIGAQVGPMESRGGA